MRKAAAACISLWCVLLAAPTFAQSLRLTTVATDIQAPLGFVQDPSQANVQFILTQGGRVRIIKDGLLLDQDFLDLTDAVGQNGFAGLLGMAMAPDYAISGRFYVNFVTSELHSVIARFVRSADDPLVADPNSRFDLVFPDGEGGVLPYIQQPYGDHSGGDLAFGSDGYLYIGLGDGGSENDPEHRAQDPNTLLGKMLRIDVSVGDDDSEGYDVPDTNPFVGQDGILSEIWAFGLRNPFRYTFDDPARGGTGALIIADVGQDAIEEIDYEPALAGGRNYGWRNYEGTRENVTDLPLFSDPTFPMFEYDHDTGKTVIAGYVYRGSALPSEFVGRLFFADFITERVWSLELNIDPDSGEATPGTRREHTIELGDRFGMITSFGMDAAGELYLVSYSNGAVYKIVAGSSDPHPVLHFDPVPVGPPAQPFQITGFAIDTGSHDSTGIDFVHVWAYPPEGPPVFLGASYGAARPEVAAQYGPQFANSGFVTTVHDMPAGLFTLVAYGFSAVTHQFSVVDVTQFVIPPQVEMQLEIESPSNSSDMPGIFTLSGWSIDRASVLTTGTEFLHVWAIDEQNVAQFLGWTTCTIDRPDIAAQYGSRFLKAGWNLTATDLHPGWWTVIVFGYSSVTHSFRQARTLLIHVTEFQPGMRLAVETPTQGQTITGPGVIRGWTLDLGAAADTTGVDTVHLWAVPTNGDPATFLGPATMGIDRPDVADDFGTQFERCGFELPFNLPPGTYNIIAYSFRVRTLGFAAATVVTITVDAPPPTNETISTSDPSLISSSP